MFIRTDRLFLRPPFPEDWRETFRGIGHRDVVRMLARAPWPYGEKDAQEFCARPRSDADLGFAITLPGPAGAPLIGQVGLNREDDAWELGYWLAREHRGRGYMVEAVLAVLETARALGIHRVDAGHYIDNPASGAVLRRCGFVETGEIRATVSAGRGGETVPARRYVCDLIDTSLPVAA